MPTLTEKDLHRVAFSVLHAAGAAEEHADTVARHLADSNLVGHDSHGFIRVPQYVGDLDEGRTDPAAQPEVVGDGKGMASVDGHGTFGQVVATFATQLAIKKAREYGISLVNMINLGHTGRVGAYPEMAAEEGMAAIMNTGFVGGKGNVAPFGGLKPKLGTNPIAMGFPYASDGPILMDFATSMAAEGKVRVYRNRGKELPDAWLLTKDGVPSRDPNAYYEGGSILPMGGLQGGHKGYALAVMVALFGAVMGSLDRPVDLANSQRTGSSIIVIDLERIAPIDSVRAQMDNLVRYLKDTPLMEGSSGVLYPGEIEATTRRQRLAEGVPVEEATWAQVVDLIKRFQLEEELKDLL